MNSTERGHLIAKIATFDKWLYEDHAYSTFVPRRPIEDFLELIQQTLDQDELQCNQRNSI